MAVLYRNTTHEVNIDAPTLSYNSANFKGFEVAVAAMNIVVPVGSVSLMPVSENLWNYNITLKDGRQWNQTIRRVPQGVSQGWYQTFSVTDEWKLEEFVPGRGIRNALLALVEQDNATEVTCTYF